MNAQAEDIADRILFEDNHLIAVTKLCGQISQGDKSGDPTLGDYIADYIKKRYQKPGNVFLVPVHRLDRPVSGVTLFAKTSKAVSRMNRLFREGLVEKRYWAVVADEPPAEEGVLVHYLERNATKNKSYAATDPPRGPKASAKRSELSYRILARSQRYILLEISMRTGRHHQIRAQLAAVGCPIKGDLKYGSPRSNPGGGISLHARFVGFKHPIGGKAIEIIAPPPSDDKLWEVFSGLLAGK